MSVASIETYDIPAPYPVMAGLGIPAERWADNHSWSTHAAWARMLVLDASSTIVRSGIYASFLDQEIQGLKAWPTTSHAVIRWPQGMALQTAAGTLASAVVPFPGEAGATADMLSFLYPGARPRSEKLVALLARIAAFGDLASDWAGGDAVAITPATVGAAMRAAEAAERAGLPLPQASPSVEGEIGLSWYCGRDRFALTIEPDMHAVWATSINRKVEKGDAVEVGSTSFPGLIVEALRVFYSASAGEVPV